MSATIGGAQQVPVKCKTCFQQKGKLSEAQINALIDMDPRKWDWSEVFEGGQHWLNKNKETGGFLEIKKGKVLVVRAYRGRKFSVTTNHNNMCVVYFHVHPQYAADFPSPQDLYGTLCLTTQRRLAWAILVSQAGILVYRPKPELAATIGCRRDAAIVLNSLNELLSTITAKPYTTRDILAAYSRAGFIMYRIKAPFSHNIDNIAVPIDAHKSDLYFV